ncbi:hypothetical protein ACU686_01400 [Yinghuangia aomiensis]
MLAFAHARCIPAQVIPVSDAAVEPPDRGAAGRPVERPDADRGAGRAGPDLDHRLAF